MTFKNYFNGLKKSEQIFLKTCQEFEDVDLEKEFKELGKVLYGSLWDDFGSGGNNDNYICNLENYVNFLTKNLKVS